MAVRTADPEIVALSLTLAVVASSPSPLLLLDGDLAVIAASTSFCDAFDIDAASLVKQSLYALGNGEWDMPGLRALIISAVSSESADEGQELNLKRAGQPDRRLIVQARRLSWLDGDQTRILVAIADVTGARASEALKDEALKRNAVLLHEVRHRVANSLQIIASVLLQNARRTESEETRGHLKDAHHRVMSVAALERLLSTSEEGDVEVHTYFTSLCENIAASLIGGGDRVTLTVEGGDGLVAGRVSVSLGLIVTELVINALKYAFPDGRSGRITVDYSFHGPNWILCVRDDGVGMPTGGVTGTGMGSSIVEALARQLNASVEISAAHPGTKVSIEHTQIALVEGEPRPASEPAAATRPASGAING